MKAERGRLLAAVLAMVMVMAGAVAVLSSSETEAEVPDSWDVGDLNVIGTADTSGFGANGGTYAYIYDSSSSTGTLTLTNYDGVGFHITADVTIVVSGDVIIRGTASDNGAYAAIYSPDNGVTIQGDLDSDDEIDDSLTIDVDGVYSGNTTNSTSNQEVTEATFGIFSAGLSISDLDIDIDVSTDDSLAFAIRNNGNNEIEFNNVTGTVAGGNRAVMVATGQMTVTASEITFIGGEKAIHASYGTSNVTINGNSTVYALLDEDFAGPQGGNDDGYGLKVSALTIEAGSTLITDGILFTEATNSGSNDTGFSIAGTLIVNDYEYAYADEVNNVTDYVEGMRIEGESVNVVVTGILEINTTLVLNGSLSTGYEDIEITVSESDGAYEASCDSAAVSSVTIDTVDGVNNMTITLIDGYTIESVTYTNDQSQEEELTANSDGTYSVSAGTYTVSVYGSVEINGNIVGDSNNFAFDDGFFPSFTEQTSYTNADGTVYVLFVNQDDDGNTYVYGLYAAPIQYNGERPSSNQITIRGTLITTDNSTEVTGINLTSVYSYWVTYDDDGSQSIYLGLYPTGDVGTYDGAIYAQYTILDDENTALFSTSDYLDLIIQGVSVDGSFAIDPGSWTIGSFDSQVAFTIDGVAYGQSQYITGATFTIGGDDTVYDEQGLLAELAELPVGNYTVTVTVTPAAGYSVLINGTANTATVTISIIQQATASDIVFHSIEDIEDEEHADLGVSVEDILFTTGDDESVSSIDLETLQAYVQYYVQFWDMGDDEDGVTQWLATGSMYLIDTADEDYDDEADVWSILTSYFSDVSFGDETGITSTSGYFLAFFVEASYDIDISSWTADVAANYLGLENESNVSIVDITRATETDADDEPVYTAPENIRFYLAYITTETVETGTETEPSSDDYYALGEYDEDAIGFYLTADFDGEASGLWTQTSHSVDLGALNFYVVILHDDSDEERVSGLVPGNEYYNYTIYYVVAEGGSIWLPTGAGAGFQYWETENGAEAAKGTANSNTVLFPTVAYDPNGDMIVDLWSVYGESTDGSGDGTVTDPTVESENILVAFSADGSTIYLVALDGGYIPAGDITVTYYYTYTYEGTAYGLTGTITITVTEDMAGSSIAEISCDLSATEYYSMITNIEAAFNGFVSPMIVYTPVSQ